MEPVRFSIIIPTVGRHCLSEALESLVGEDFKRGDEVLLVGDGDFPSAHSQWLKFSLPGKYIEVGPFGHWGHGARNCVIDKRIPQGTHLIAMDDDNLFRRGSLATIREIVSQSPESLFLFRVQFGFGLIWTRWGLVVPGNVETSGFVTPNIPEKLGLYSSHHSGDYEYIRRTVAKFPDGALKWRREIIGKYRKVEGVRYLNRD